MKKAGHCPAFFVVVRALPSVDQAQFHATGFLLVAAADGHFGLAQPDAVARHASACERRARGQGALLGEFGIPR
ncbi:MAG: hypothetical protein ACK4PH_04445, partial [Aquincola tertiaricarbonis]